MIQDCFGFTSRNPCKNIRNPLIFCKNGYLLIFFECQKITNSLASKLASNFYTFDTCIIIYKNNKIIRFVTERINYYFIGHHKSKPYLFENIFVDKIRLPKYGVAHIIKADKEGRRFNRRSNFRVWLGQHCHIALRGSKAQHDAMIKDLSSTGIGLIIKKEYTVNIGDEIEVQFNDEKYNEQREDYQFTLHTIKGEVVRVFDSNEKADIVGCRITEGQEGAEKFVAMKQREKNKVGRKTSDLISMFVGKEGKDDEE